MLKPVKGSRTHARRSMTSNPDDDGGSDLTSDLYEETQDPIADPTKELRSIESISPAPVSEGTKTNSSSSSQSPARAKFEAEEKENAQQFVQCLRQAVPVMMDSMSVWEVDESLQDLAARFCSSLPQNSLESQSDMSISGVVLNSDGVYVAAITALKLNLRLLTSGYYVNQQNVPMSEVASVLMRIQIVKWRQKTKLATHRRMRMRRESKVNGKSELRCKARCTL
ncbi:hypothetical protein BsWGS_03473 [Bradybaena similaris]